MAPIEQMWHVSISHASNRIRDKHKLDDTLKHLN